VAIPTVHEFERHRTSMSNISFTLSVIDIGTEVLYVLQEYPTRVRELTLSAIFLCSYIGGENKLNGTFIVVNAPKFKAPVGVYRHYNFLTFNVQTHPQSVPRFSSLIEAGVDY
jgi:hypothetical protein